METRFPPVLNHCFPGCRVEPGVAGYQFRRAIQPLFMKLHRRNQQVLIMGPLIIDFVGNDDLVLGFLKLDHLPELGGLAGFAFANDFCVRLEDADQLAFGSGIAAEHACLALTNHLLYKGDERVQSTPQTL